MAISKTLEAIEELGKELLTSEAEHLKGLKDDVKDMIAAVLLEESPEIRDELMIEVKGIFETLLEAQEQTIAKSTRKLYIKAITTIISLV